MPAAYHDPHSPWLSPELRLLVRIDFGLLTGGLSTGAAIRQRRTARLFATSPTIGRRSWDTLASPVRQRRRWGWPLKRRWSWFWTRPWFRLGLGRWLWLWTWGRGRLADGDVPPELTTTLARRLRGHAPRIVWLSLPYHDCSPLPPAAQ